MRGGKIWQAETGRGAVWACAAEAACFTWNNLAQSAPGEQGGKARTGALGRIVLSLASVSDRIAANCTPLKNRFQGGFA